MGGSGRLRDHERVFEIDTSAHGIPFDQGMPSVSAAAMGRECEASLVCQPEQQLLRNVRIAEVGIAHVGISHVGTTETFQVDFDPDVIGLAELLDVFWASHPSTSRRGVLTGAGSGGAAVDEIRFERSGTGTHIDYVADIRLGGLLRLVQPFLGGSFRKIAKDALAGMEKTLSEMAARETAGSRQG